jgi:ABC-type bacteriocin/lantibiotic exporter with double-glycine peptidase domain
LSHNLINELFFIKVGESGSGKSTIFALVERFYDPDSGQLLIDGVDLRELDPKWYHRHVAIVSQVHNIPFQECNFLILIDILKTINIKIN